ncbi:amino acid deaminase [Lysinibacter sp. HNR]|uniref:amino acid deaminase n=1 Tax=Lysinibacter sp. HNR TaxID=3031408 RepID=UPI002435EF29|nr:amino acid deaminase [Lysinibacter sp. HNR]WGD37199.1 amino acid deaminase [Lysinibacter sp. HNR]
MPPTALGPQHKSLPPRLWGSSLDNLGEAATHVSQWQTPLLTLDQRALNHNVATYFHWLHERKLLLAPHGKTTMSPTLWHQLLDAGAWGITFSTAWQVEIARHNGVRRIMLANSLLDPVGLTWISRELDANPSLEIIAWVDSVASAQRMEEVLSPLNIARRIPLIAELGAAGGRTGARNPADALALAEYVADSSVLTLAGVGGYEGILAQDRSPEGLSRVRNYLEALAGLLSDTIAEGMYTRHPILTAGGSAYFDLVADATSHLTDQADVVLRSGAFQIHDDGFYSRVSPLRDVSGEEVSVAGSLGEEHFIPGMHGWARVVSRPEPGLALLDAGRRDFPYDYDLPEAQLIMGASPAESAEALAGSEVFAINDQHLYLRLGPNATEHTLPVGSVVRFGLSHPCTAMDKWRLVPIVADATQDDPLVISAVETWF